MTDFVSLTTALDGWFDKPLSELPEATQERVRQDFFPMPWDGLSAEQRQSVARQWDYNHDSTTEPDRQFWFDFFIKKGELEKQIERWESLAETTAGELAQKELRQKELIDELARMQRHEERARGDYLPESADIPCHAVVALEIRRRFRVLPAPSTNIDWWKKMMRDAMRNGLAECSWIAAASC